MESSSSRAICALESLICGLKLVICALDLTLLLPWDTCFQVSASHSPAADTWTTKLNHLEKYPLAVTRPPVNLEESLKATLKTMCVALIGGSAPSDLAKNHPLTFLNVELRRFQTVKHQQGRYDCLQIWNVLFSQWHSSDSFLNYLYGFQMYPAKSFWNKAATLSPELHQIFVQFIYIDWRSTPSAAAEMEFGALIREKFFIRKKRVAVFFLGQREGRKESIDKAWGGGGGGFFNYFFQYNKIYERILNQQLKKDE